MKRNSFTEIRKARGRSERRVKAPKPVKAWAIMDVYANRFVGFATAQTRDDIWKYFAKDEEDKAWCKRNGFRAVHVLISPLP